MTQTRTGRIVRLAVSTALATTLLTGCNAKVAPSAAYSAAKAEAALEHGRAGKAVGHAEAAVLADPRDGQARVLLGNAYLEAGRFGSAATAFGEAMELGETAPRTVISYALAQSAIGNGADAIATLEQFEAALDPADFGLAVALAGRPQQGVHVLGNALRNGQNTPKVRQNLAYAYALMGEWRAARLMVAEDLPADQVGERMALWGSMAPPEHTPLRIANLLGVEVAQDPGQPAMLALANHPSVDQLAAESVAVELAAADSSFIAASDLPASPSALTIADAGDAGLADAALAGPRFVSRPVVQQVPASAARPAPRRATAAPRMASAPRTASASRTALAEGDHNIQLGSYFSMSDAQAAWKLFQARYPELEDAERLITRARVNGKIYYRVAAGGIARGDARSMCSSIRKKGAGCITYAANSPLPGTLDRSMRVAAR